MKPCVIFQFAIFIVLVNPIKCCEKIQILYITTIFQNLFSIADALEIEPLVILKDLNAGHNTVGGNIEFQCLTTFSTKYVLLEWDTPNDTIQRNATLTKNTNSTYVTISTLIIHEGEMQHSGYYTCTIIHKEWNQTVASRRMWVTIYDKEDSTFEFENNKQFFKKADAEIEVEIKAHPNISVIWYNPRQEIVTNSSNITIALISISNNEKYNYKTILRFDYITNTDLGRYFFIVQYGIEKKKVYVDVLMEEQIALSLNMVEINETEMTATYQCKAAGKEKPHIVWKFRPCIWFSCLNKTTQFSNKTTELILKESYHEDRGLQTISYVLVNLTRLGVLKCVTQNSEAIEPINYVQNGFENFISDKRNYRIKKQKLGFGYGQFVLISCPRSRNVYTPHILWYHNDKKMNEENYYYTNTYDVLLLDKFLSLLHFDFVVENQIGNYSCQVLTKSGKTESKTVEVVSKHMFRIYPLMLLQDVNSGHTSVGQDIKLMCTATFHKYIKIRWLFMQSYEKNRDLIQTKYFDDVTKFVAKEKMFIKNVYLNCSDECITTSYLTITHANISERGYYGCGFEKEDIIKIYGYYIWVQVYEINDTSLTFYKEPIFRVQDMNIKILMTAHPHPVVKWYDNHGKEIPASLNASNYLVNFRWMWEKTTTIDINYEAELKFKTIDMKDFGNYTIVAENGNKTIRQSIRVNVTGVPATKIYIHETFESNATFKCVSTAYPKPSIEWYIKKCTTLKCCREIANATFTAQNGYAYKAQLRNETEGLQHVSYISVNWSQRGVLVCRGVNSFGENYSYEPLLGSGTGFEIFTENNAKNFNKTIEFVGQNELKVICAVSNLGYTNEIAWSGNASQMKYFPTYDWRKKGKITREYFNFSTFSIATIPVNSPSDGFYSCTTLNKNSRNINSRSLFVKSRLSSYVRISKTNMGNKSFQVDDTSKWAFYCFVEGFPTPTVKWYKNKEEIVFSERFRFSNNRQVLEIDYVVPEDQGVYMCEVSNLFNKSVEYGRLNVVIPLRWEYIQVVLVVCAIFVIITLQIMKINQVKKEKKLSLYGLIYSHKGALENINPTLSIEDQAALLPFDRKWEIPLKKIEMGKQLGSGAFGVTFQANVTNHFLDDENKTVAVKTINPMSGYECVKALASEMKIMSHLGSHVNIVNFLGACTKYIIRHELYIILEFCSFGNLLKYIQCYSKNFIDQKDDDSDDFVWSCDDSDLENFEKRASVSSKDFLIWSFQIARGMEYLGSRKVVHGDLAARNVLLTEKNVIKLCDFGLAKNVYNYGNYVKKSEGPLPVKWMAIEAIEKGIFSTQSDIWSFGVVLWEIFSLGKTPFSGVTVDENFCKKVNNGLRMEKPDAATTKIYELMLACWEVDPTKRPSFGDLIGEIGALLGEPVKNYYVIMNNDHLLTNKERFDNAPDYLTMVPSPTYENVVSNLSG